MRRARVWRDGAWRFEVRAAGRVFMRGRRHSWQAAMTAVYTYLAAS